MWKKFKIEGKELLIKHSLIDECHKIVVTNFINLWHEEIANEDLLIRCKGMNRLVEATDEVFLRNALSLLQTEADHVIRSFVQADHETVLELHTCLDGLKFRIKFFLKLANNILMFEELTCPLLTVVADLEKRNQLLMDMIKKKDLEILEYKLEGAQISRKAVETEQFDADVFSLQCAEALSNVKSCVVSRPSHALSPLVQGLLHHVSSLTVLANNTEDEAVKTKSKPLVKLRSPSRNKKPKLYDDEVVDNHSIINTEEKYGADEIEEAKNEAGKSIGNIKSEKQQGTKKPKSRIQNVLPNL